MKHNDDFRASVEHDSEQQNQAEQHPAGLLGFLFYGGTLGLILVIPMIAGAYLGSWLDSLSEGFETRWTVSFIIIGIVCGIWNVIWYIRGRI